MKSTPLEGMLAVNGFFTSAFAVLGDTSGAIGNGPIGGISRISQIFSLPQFRGGIEVMSYDLEINAWTVFYGDDPATGIRDIFSATLNTLLLFSWKTEQ